MFKILILIVLVQFMSCKPVKSPLHLDVEITIPPHLARLDPNSRPAILTLSNNTLTQMGFNFIQSAASLSFTKSQIAFIG